MEQIWKVDSVDIDGNICLGLTEFLSAQFKKQYKVECKLTKNLTSEQKVFIEDWTIINQKIYGCILSLTSSVMPKIFEFEFTKPTIWTKMAGQRFYNVFKSSNPLIISGQPNV